MLERNCREFGVTFFGMHDRRSGIVHIIGPELGITHPGQTIVCGDSHTSTHGAFGALAFGIGTSEVEHVLATQTLLQRKSKTMEIRVDGELAFGITSKDVILAVIGTIGTSGATGYVVEYTGSVMRSLSMEGRMTICNMSIEAGARAGLISPDETLQTLSFPAVGSTRVSGTVDGYRSPAYLVPVAKRQTLTVTLESASSNAYFNIHDAADSSGYAVFNGNSGDRTARLTAPRDMSYVIRPFQPRASARRNEQVPYSFAVERG